MMKILHFKEVESATVQIICGNRSGTAFFITTSKDKQILLTSDHTLTDGNPIKIIVSFEKEIEAEILERIPDRDVAILQIKENLNETFSRIPLSNGQVADDEQWQTYGFPAERVNSAARYNGIVSRTNEGAKWDIDLNCEQYNNLGDFSGLSGAPLVIDGMVAGIIGYDLAGTFGATSIRSITEKLLGHDIYVEKTEHHSIPDSIEKDISTTTPNEEVLQMIKAVVKKEIAGSYFLVSGNPGSGKTTIAAQLEFNDANYIVCDKFFVKVPEEETIPTQIRATPEFFMKWVEEVYFRILFNTVPSKSDKPLNDRILSIHQGINQLSEHYKQQSKIAFLIIDGLDDVSKSKIEDYLSVLPIKLPANIKVIFLCTSKMVLPNTLQSEIDSTKEIKVTPLSIQNAEKYLLKHLKSKNLTSSQISELAQKSEGHPLYLRYLTKYVMGLDEISSIDEWINSIPVIGGEIEKYYNKIWGQLNEGTNETWLAATLSRFRLPVSKTILLETLPSESRYSFLSSFSKIQHLLKDDERISVYHTSFSDFIKSKTVDINERIHDNISQYIETYPTTTFGISEKIIHLANGKHDNKRKALNECNQAWVDDCALNSVNPDIVLSDVRNIIGIAAEFGIAHKVISLLLLSQRVNFRYNTLLQENAFFLVNALLALQKPEEAIRYVVRNKTLIVSDSDALYLLQMFYEYESLEQAEILQNTINQVCVNILESGLNTETFNRYIDLKFSAVTLSSNSDFKNAYHEFDHIQKVSIKMLKHSGNSEDGIHDFKDGIGSYNMGYYIWRFNTPPFAKKVEAELKKFKFDNRSSGFIALTIYQALQFQERSPKIKTNDNILEWVEDLEYVIDRYGTHADYQFYILNILLGRSKRIDLIEMLFQKIYPGHEDLDFRNDNGVDLNHKAIHRFTLYTECSGFLDAKNEYPELTKYGYHTYWEKNIKGIITYLSFLTGKIMRYRSEGNDEEIQKLESQVVKLIDSLVPSLKERMTWKRSYAIPEHIFRIIYNKLIRLLINFFPDHIPIFIEHTIEKGKYQLGLYVEGHIDCLLEVSKELAKKTDQRVTAFRVAKILEGQIISAVENRLERNEYLLRLVELFALLKNEDKAKAVFKEMIDTSMGPSWYKEAQLGIINTAVSNILPQEKDFSYLQKFAAHLDHASGEMTFQRYVKQQKESFVGDLAKIGFLNKSIQYFKHLLLPDYETVISNAESGVVDMLYKGYGYVLGARAIEEQAGILDLLLNIDCSNSLVAWGLCELFILGDDRYIDGYSTVQAGILNKFEKTDSNKSDILFKRLSQFVVTEVDDEYRYKYLGELSRELSTTNFETFKHNLEQVGMRPSQPKSEEKEIEVSPDETKDPLDKLVAAKLEVDEMLGTENKSGARKAIVNALREIQNKKYGIWSFNYSNKIDDIRGLLSKSYNSSSEFIKDIKDLILNEPYFEEWVIANQIIGLLQNIDDESEKQQILSAVLEHIDLMVRTPSNFYEKYQWLNKDETKIDSDQQERVLAKFLIWFLNHPSRIVKNRTSEILTWLGATIPDVIIPILIEEMLEDGYCISKELSASIIHQVSNLNPPNFWKWLKRALEENEEGILKLRHFMIRDSLIRALEGIKSNGESDCDSWIKKMEVGFPNTKLTSGEIILEDEYLEPISNYIFELNELKILNKEFAKTLIKTIKELSPLNISDAEKASSYIDRSFNDHNEIDLVSDFHTILRYALNIAITHCVAIKKSAEVGNILRYYQPTFPENYLRAQINIDEVDFEKAVINIFETGEINIQDLLINKEIPLNYYSLKFSDSRSHSDKSIELTSYLVPKDKYTEKGISYAMATFSENGYPNNIVHRPKSDAIPLILRCERTNSMIGSDVVPSLLDTGSEKIPDVIKQNANSFCWRRGRNWGQYRQGAAQKTGHFISISQEKIATLKAEYKLIWCIYSDYERKLIDIFEQKEIER